MDSKTVQEIVGNLRQPQVIRIDDQHQYLVSPPGSVVQKMETPPAPWTEQRLSLLTPEDFCRYVTDFGDKAETIIFANEPSARYEAVIDYHATKGPDARGHCDHVATYGCPTSLQWQLWVKLNGKAMGQVDFAKFLEDNLTDIKTPTPAALLQVALELEVHKNAKYASEIRLDNGSRELTFNEQVQQQTRPGKQTLPTEFGIEIPVFLDGKLWPIQCRLRYRLQDGVLALWYEMVRYEDVYRLAVKEITDRVVKGLPGFRLVRGQRA